MENEAQSENSRQLTKPSDQMPTEVRLKAGKFLPKRKKGPSLFSIISPGGKDPGVVRRPGGFSNNLSWKWERG